MKSYQANARPYGEEPVDSWPVVILGVSLIALLIGVGSIASIAINTHAAEQVERNAIPKG